MLNNMGLGFSLTASDAASLNIMRVAGSLGALRVSGDNAALSFDKVAGRMRDATTGRYAARPQGMMNPQFIGEVSSQLGSMGQKLSVVGAASFGALGLAAHAASEFEAGLAELGTLVDQTKFPMASMNALVKDMLSEYGGDSRTVIAATYQAISAGATDAAKANSILKAASELAIAGATDQKTALVGLTKVLNNYNMEFSRASEVGDAFLTAVQGGSTTMGELGASIGDVAAGAKNAGISMNELIGALGTGATLMGNTATAATGLKATIQSMAHPTSEAAAEAKRLGISFDAATMRSKGLQGVLKDITTSSKFSADSISKLFSSQEAANFITALSANSMSAYNDMMDSMGKKSGKARAAFEQMSNTMEQQLSVLKANLETITVEVGMSLAPVTGVLVGFLKDMAKGFLALSPGIKKAVAFFGLAFAVITSVAGATLAGAAAIGALVLAAEAIAVGLAVATGGFVLLLAVMAPVIAAGAIMYQVWTRDLGGLATRVRGYVDSMKLAFSGLSQLFSDGAFSGDVMRDLAKVENSGIKTFAINVFLWFNRIKNFMAGVGESFSAGMVTIRPTFDSIAQALSRLFSRFVPVKDTLSTAQEKFDAFGGAGKSTGTVLVAIVDKVAKAVLGMIAFVDGALEVWHGISPALNAAWDAAKALFGAFWQLTAVMTGNNATGQQTSDFWRGLGNILGFFANVVLANVVGGFRLLAGVVSMVSGAMGGVIAMFQGIIQAVVTGIRIIVAFFSGDWAGAWKLAGKMTEDWAQTVLTMFTRVVGGAAAMIDQLGKLAGKDLGLQAKVTAMGTLSPRSTASAPALPAPPGAPSAATMPAVAQAAGQQASTGALASALTQTAQRPIEMSVKSQLVIDGQVLAEANQKANQQNAGRGFAPTTAPT